MLIRQLFDHGLPPKVLKTFGIYVTNEIYRDYMRCGATYAMEPASGSADHVSVLIGEGR